VVQNCCRRLSLTPGGEIGRRMGLKIPDLTVCGFDSRPGDHYVVAGIITRETKETRNN
jgi:hypothetical protein